jgi:hypothetical protein
MKWLLIILLQGSQNVSQIPFEDKAACENARNELKQYVQALRNGPGVSACLPSKSAGNG